MSETTVFHASLILLLLADLAVIVRAMWRAS